MSYASVLVHVQADEQLRYRLNVACRVAKRFDAFLIGVAVEMIRAAPFDDGYTSIDAQWFAVMRDNALNSQDTARALFEAGAAGLSHGSLWIAGFDFPAAALARAARGADLIVTSPPPPGRRDAYVDAGAAELALISGRPVLVAPGDGAPLAAKRIVLAWKDTREARRAAADAMPFLEQADAVLVLEVCSADDASEAGMRTAEVVAALARHGVAAQGKVTVGRLSAGEEIILEAETFGADLIVSGAFGHTRLGEWAFGGVTSELLRQKSRYILLSH